MKKLFTAILLLAMFALVQSSFAQLSGTKTIPGNYATITLAVADLNAQGVGAGGVTFNVAAGYTETISAPISITATGTSGNPIVFQKSGAGANPLITSYTGGTGTPGTAVQDGIWNLVGSDYVVIDGIDLTDNPANTTNPSTMEYGYGMFKASVTDGCQFNTIKNCVVTLNRLNNVSGTAPAVDGSRAINIMNALVTTQTTAVVPTAASGTNSYNSFYSNTLQNCNIGIALIGYAGATPFTLCDFGNDVGGTSLATGNNIINFGGGASATNPAAGVRTLAQYNFNVSYNTINNNNGSGVNHVSTLRGIYLNTAVSASSNINNNTLSISSGATTSQVSVIENVSGATSAGNTVNINNNTINNCNWTTATSGIFYGIYNTASAATVNIINNSFATLTRPGTGASNLIYNSGAVGTALSISNNTYTNLSIASTANVYFIYNSNATNNMTISNNTISGTFTKTGAGGTVYGYYNFGSPTGGTATFNANNYSNITLTGATTFYGIQHYTGTSQAMVFTNNTISNISGGSSSMYGIFQGYGAAGCTINSNTVSNWTGSGAMYGITFGNSSAPTSLTVYNNNVNGLNTSGAVAVYGLQNVAGTANSVYKNRVYNLQANNVSGLVYGIYVSAGTLANIYNNYVSDLRAPLATGANAIGGIYIAGGTTINLYYNTVYLNAVSSGATFGTSAVYKSSTTTSEFRNNIFVNVSTPGTTSGVTAALRWSGVYNATYYNATSNNNDFYAGTPSANMLIYYDGTNSDQTIAAYQTRVSTRDALSFTELPTFVNVATTPYDLHLSTAIATQCESGGSTVSTPALVDDYDGNARYPNSGYPNNPSYPAYGTDVGADEFAGIWKDLLPPTISYSALLNTPSTSARTLIATITDPSGVPVVTPGWPNLYYKINAGAYTAVTPTTVAGNQYTYIFGSGVTIGDVVSYYIVARDMAAIPNIGAFPSVGSGTFTYDPPAAGTPPTTPSSYTISASALSGDYTVGLLIFNKISGKNITFEKVTKKVMKEVVIDEPVQMKKDEKGNNKVTDSNINSDRITGKTKLVEVDEISWIPMENGKEYAGNLYIKKSENPNYNYPSNVNGIYATITAAINDLNLRGVSGNTRFLFNDATYPTETLPLTVNIANENLTSATKTVTFKPNTGVVSTISGAAASSRIFAIRNNYVTIDGSNTTNGTTRDLTIQNTSATTPQVLLFGSTGTTPITNGVLKNCIMINGANTSSGVVVSDGTTSGNAGYFNNITIQNNSFQLAYIALYCNAVIATGNGSGLNISGNDFNTIGTNAVRLVGAYVGGVDGATVSNNNIGNFNVLDAANCSGIWFATGTVNSTITGNTITNLVGAAIGAPRGIAVSSAYANANINLTGNTISNISCAYSAPPYGIYVFSTTSGVSIKKNKISGLLNTSASGYGARGINIATTVSPANIDIINNFVWNIKATSDASVTYWGIGIALDATINTVNVYFNTVNLYGTLAGYTSGTIHSAFYVGAGVSLLNTRDNIFVNTFDNTTSSTDKSYSIYTAGTSTAFTDINYSDYYVSGTPGILGYLGADKLTIADWRTATGKDLNSASANPLFINDSTLYIVPTQISPVGDAGQFIATVTDDIDGNTRSATTPDMGADEYIPLTPTLLSPANNSVGNNLSLNLVWTKPAGATQYNLMVATDAGFTSVIVNDTTLTDSIYTLSNLNTLTTYYWKVSAKYTAWGYFSSVSNFKTLGSPTTVVLSAPSNNSIDQPTSLNFNWFKAVDQTDKIKKGNNNSSPSAVSNYWFELATDTGFVTVINRDSTLTDSTKSVTGLNYNAKYYWRVKAKNQIGWASFSSVWNFTTIPNSPSGIVLLSPANNATNQPYTNLTFTWTKALETLAKNKSISNYWFELATDAGFTTGVLRDSLLTDTTKTIATLTSNVNYWWRVKAKNQTGWGAFTSAFTFKTTLDPTFLAQANFTSVLIPQVMAGGGSIAGGTTRLPIVIRATVSNLVPNKLYRFYNGGAIYTDLGTGAYGAGNSMYINPDSVNNRYTTSVSLTTLGGYDVFRADGSGNCTRWFSFIGTGNATRFVAGKYVIPSIVLGDSLGVIVARYALNDSIKVVNISSNAVDTCGTGIYGISVAFPKNIVPLFDNTSGTGKPLTITYLEDDGVTVASSAPFYTTFVNAQNGRWGTVIPNINANGVRRVEQRDKVTGNLMTFNTSAAGLWPSGVNTVNPTGGLTTPLGLLLVDAPLLDYATLVSPANNATNQALSLTLNWNAITYASSYRVQLATDSAFTAIIKDSTGLTTNSLAVTGLINNQSYWWRVAGTTTTGTAPFGTAFTFTTIPNPPTVPTLVSPANGSLGNPLNLSLVWTKPALSTGYNVVLATDAGFTTIILNDSTLTDSIKTLTNLTPLTTYYWKVRAKNLGGWSSFSAAFNFKTVGSATQVVLSTPANNSTGQPTSITFKWFKANDQTDIQNINKGNKENVDGPTVVSNYWFELSNDSLFSTLVARDTTLTDTTKFVTGLSYTTSYYWRVKAKNQIGWGSFSNRFKFTTLTPTLSLNLKVYLEGFWDGTTQVSDTAMVYLANATTPYAYVDTAKVVLSATGTASMNFNRVTTGSYYIVVNHRNHLETWSKLPQAFVGGTPLNYDFTTAGTQAFGDNMKQVGSVWVLFGGDANRDGSVDALDVVFVVNQFGTQGYLQADFNGDNDVTGADIALFVPNFGLTKIIPTLVVTPIEPKIKTKDYDMTRISKNKVNSTESDKVKKNTVKNNK